MEGERREWGKRLWMVLCRLIVEVVCVEGVVEEVEEGVEVLGGEFVEIWLLE